MKKFLYLIVYIFLNGCSTNVKQPINESYNDVANKLKTEKPFHYIAIKPDYFKLDYPGFLIGIEKSNFITIGTEYPLYDDCSLDNKYCLDTGSFYLKDKKDTKDEIEKRLNGSTFGRLTRRAKTQFVSHIVKFTETGSDDKRQSCFVYNVYGTNGTGCNTSVQPIKDDYFKNGWDAVENLQEDLKTMVVEQQITHLFLFSTGWNTPQVESLANYNDLYFNLIKASGDAYGDSFRPLFIGLTWPSQWNNLIGDLGLDLGNKKNDADEIGLIWANLITQRVLLPQKNISDVKVVLIGHSFGARLLSRAAYSGYLLNENPNKIDLLVGLQGAFTLNRFAEVSVSDAPYRDYKNFVNNAFFTTSRYDNAVGSMSHIVPYIGSEKARSKSNENSYNGIFQTMNANDNGNIEGLSCDSSKIKLINADEFIKSNIPGTGGGAHSDIYDTEVGNMLWQIIDKCLN